MKSNIDYDYDTVINFCKSAACDSIESLAKDLNNLTKELDNCQDRFHCKGGESANAVIEIYYGFSTLIGQSNGCQSGEALGGLVAGSAQIVNTCYAEAMIDKQTAESGFSSGGGYAGAGTVSAGVSRAPQKKTGFFGRLGATIGTIGTGLVTGVVKFGETLVDVATVAGTALLTIPTTIYDGVGATISGIQGKEYDCITDDMWKGSMGFVTTDYVGGWADSFYDNTAAGRTLKENAYAFDAVRGVSEFAGEFAGGMITGSAVASAIGKGASAATAGAELLAGPADDIARIGINYADDVARIGVNYADDVARIGVSQGNELIQVGARGTQVVQAGARGTQVVQAGASMANDGTIITDILDASGNVIGHGTAREIASTPIKQTVFSNIPSGYKKAAAAAVGTTVVGGALNNDDNR